MSKNYLRLKIGEKEVGLKFNIGTLKAVGEITGRDPFSVRCDTGNFSEVAAFGKTIFHAAIISNYRSRKVDIDFTPADIDEWFEELTAKDVTTIVNMYTDPGDSSPTVNGEVVKDTQPGIIL